MAQPPSPRFEGAARIGAWICATIALAALALYPALFNGFPLVFSDTNVYIDRWNVAGDGGFPVFYPLFVTLTSGLGLGATVGIQALLMSAVVLTFLRVAGGLRSVAALTAVGAGVLLANQGPWLASWVMPDFLAALGAAAVALLILKPGPMTRATQAGLAIVALFAALSATANVALLTGLALFCLALRWLLLQQRPRLATCFILIGAVTTVLAATLVSNRAIQGYARLNVASSGVTFGRLADIGLAQTYLRETCPGSPGFLCNALDRLSRHQRGEQTFLWDGLADETDAWHDDRGEYARLSRKILLAHGWEYLREGWLDAGRLLAEPTLGNPRMFELIPYGHGLVRKKVENDHPGDLAAFNGARQQTGQLLPYFPVRWFAASTYAGYASLLILGGIAWRRGDRMGAALALAAAAFIVAEILLHATLVGAFARYHVKVAWLGWLFAAALLARWAAAAEAPSARRLRGLRPVPVE